MHPLICQVGPFPVYSFGLMFLAAVIICSVLLARDGRRIGKTSEEMYDFVFWVIIGGIVGARLFFIGLNFSFFVENPGEIIKLNKGGLAWQGGFLIGALTAVVYTRRLKMSVPSLADLVAPYLALGQAIGRIGCFLNGCCYGRPVSWGIYFPVHGERLHPTQLYDFVALLTLFFILKSSAKRLKNAGAVFALYLVLAALERFINEFFRNDHVVVYGGLSIFQIVSVCFFVLGLGLFIWLVRRKGSPT